MGHFPRNVTRWPDGRIPYTIAKVVSGTSRTNLDAAILTWNAANVGITLAPKGATDVSSVHFTGALVATTCSSGVGMQGLLQEIRCSYPRLVAGVRPEAWVHEIGHAVGLVHEHQRLDRDDFVTFNKGIALLAGQRMHNYTKFLALSHATQGPYDCVSVMHYPRRRAPWGTTYLDGKGSGGCPAGGIGGTKLTATDLATVRALYS